MENSILEYLTIKSKEKNIPLTTISDDIFKCCKCGKDLDDYDLNHIINDNRCCWKCFETTHFNEWKNR